MKIEKKIIRAFLILLITLLFSGLCLFYVINPGLVQTLIPESIGVATIINDTDTHPPTTTINDTEANGIVIFVPSHKLPDRLKATLQNWVKQLELVDNVDLFFVATNKWDNENAESLHVENVNTIELSYKLRKELETRNKLFLQSPWQWSIGTTPFLALNQLPNRENYKYVWYFDPDIEFLGNFTYFIADLYGLNVNYDIISNIAVKSIKVAKAFDVGPNKFFRVHEKWRWDDCSAFESLKTGKADFGVFPAALRMHVDIVNALPLYFDCCMCFCEYYIPNVCNEVRNGKCTVSPMHRKIIGWTNNGGLEKDSFTYLADQFCIYGNDPKYNDTFWHPVKFQEDWRKVKCADSLLHNYYMGSKTDIKIEYDYRFVNGGPYLYT